MEDITTNTQKQSLSLYFTFFFAWFVSEEIQSVQIDAVISIIAPILAGVIVIWYVITFGSIRKKFLSEGFTITFFMFTAFNISILLFGMIAWYSLSLRLAIAVIFILLSVAIASFKYDMVDLLRVGIDAEGLEFYTRANEKMKTKKTLF